MKALVDNVDKHDTADLVNTMMNTMRVRTMPTLVMMKRKLKKRVLAWRS